MTLETINLMSRQQLVEADIALGVERWGEGERLKLAKMALAKSEATIRAQLAAAHKLDANKAKGVRLIKKGAAHCLDDRIS